MIAPFLGGLESVFAWLLEASWQASVLAVLVLALQAALRGRLNPRWHHALWLLVVARLLLPALPESALSLFQFAPEPPAAMTQSIKEPIFAPQPPEPVAITVLPAPSAPYPYSAFTVLALVWLAGALLSLLVTWQVNRRFARHVTAARAIDDPRLLELAATARKELGIRCTLRIIESARVQSPAIMGLFRPTLVLPTGVRTQFTDDELRFIFLHEFAHLKRGDLVLQWLVALLQSLHWFNPVLWYAFRRLRADREPATDALVLSRTGEAQKESYGQVLVKLLEHYKARHSVPTLVGILEDRDLFKRRFTLIAKFTQGAYGWSFLGIIVLALLSVVCLTKANAKDGPMKAAKYLELVFVEEPGAINSSGCGPVSEDDVVRLQNSPKNKVTVLADIALHDGPISLKEKTPAGFSLSITGDWQSAVKTPQKIDYRIDGTSTLSPNGAMMARSWETKDELSEDAPLVVFQPWTLVSHANVIIRIVDHPTLANSQTDTGSQPLGASGDPKAALSSDTLAQLVLALNAHATAVPSDHQRLQILQGFYGADGAWRDVTGILQQLLQNNSLKVSWQQPYTEIGGDPAFLQVKTLVVSYRLDGIEKIATFGEENPPVGLQATLSAPPASTSNAPAGTSTNSDPLIVRTFLVPVGFFKAPIVDNADVKPDLIARGIAFPAGATAVSLTSGKVVVRNTPDQLDKLATLIQKAAVPGGKVEIGLKAIEIPEDIYLANKAKVEAAVENADLGFFMQVKGVVIVSTPTVTTMPGTKATIEIVREFPYPVTFEPAKLVMKPGGVLRVPPTPHEFVTKDVGLSAEITPTINAADSPEPGKIMLTGKFTVTEFEGFTASNLNVKMPAFETRESFFIESLSDRETKGIWIPGVRGDEQFVTDTEKAGAMRSTKTVEDNKRLLLFVSARRFP